MNSYQTIYSCFVYVNLCCYYCCCFMVAIDFNSWICIDLPIFCSFRILGETTSGCVIGGTALWRRGMHVMANFREPSCFITMYTISAILTNFRLPCLLAFVHWNTLTQPANGPYKLTPLKGFFRCSAHSRVLRNLICVPARNKVNFWGFRRRSGEGEFHLKKISIHLRHKIIWKTASK